MIYTRILLEHAAMAWFVRETNPGAFPDGTYVVDYGRGAGIRGEGQDPVSAIVDLYEKTEHLR
jgi:hypothetical protein